MSGHSKWAQIKRKKALTDTKKGRLFSKLSKLIEIAAKNGSDIKTNFSLKAVVDQAKAVNMPAANIEKAIKKGSGDSGEDGGLETVLYEAYGPGGVALLMMGITSNKNRTVAEVKHILAQYGGRLAEAGSVKWLFGEKGVIYIPKGDHDLAEVEELAIIDNAEDVRGSDEGFEIIAPVSEFEHLKKVFQDKGFPINDSAIEWLPKNSIVLDEKNNLELEKLLDALDGNEDVTEVFTNSN